MKVKGLWNYKTRKPIKTKDLNRFDGSFKNLCRAMITFPVD